MKNRKMGQKIAISFGVVIACFLITVMAMFYGMSSISEKYSKFYENSHTALTHTYESRLYAQSTMKSVALAALVETSDESIQYGQAAQGYVDLMMESVKWLSEHYQGDQTLLKEFEALVLQGAPIRESIVEYAALGTARGDEQARTLLLNQYNPLLESAIDKLQQFAVQVSAESEDEFNMSMTTRNVLFAISAVIIVVALIVTCIIAKALIRTIVNPVQQLEKAMSEMERGSLDINVDYESEDELGSLVKDLRTVTDFLKGVVADEDNMLAEFSKGNFDVSSSMEKEYRGAYLSIYESMIRLRDNLSSTLMHVTQTADQVAAGSEQVSSGAQALSQGATEQQLLWKSWQLPSTRSQNM